MTGGIDGPSGPGGVDPQDRAAGPEGASGASRADSAARIEGASADHFVDGLSGVDGAAAAGAMGALSGATLERLTGRIQERLDAGDSRQDLLENLVRGELESNQGTDRATQFVMEKVQEDPALGELFEKLVRHVEEQNRKGTS